jgi:non-heme chloroperoxidase
VAGVVVIEAIESGRKNWVPPISAMAASRRRRIYTAHQVAIRLVASGLMVLVASCASSNSRAARVAPSSVLIEGEALAYVDIGQGRPIILVHGGFQDYRMWQPFLDGLASARRVIAYSRRNHSPNRTDSNGIPDYAADRHGQDLAALIRRLGLGQVDLVGHSSGASTVLFLAAQHPELVRSIVVVEPPLATMLTNSKEDQTSMAEFMSHLSSALAALRENDRSAAVRLFALRWEVPEHMSAGPRARRQ